MADRCSFRFVDQIERAFNAIKTSKMNYIWTWNELLEQFFIYGSF